jgi:hypothetical protein
LCNHVRDGMATGRAKGLNHLKHGITPTAAEIELQQLIAAAQKGP